MTCAGAGFGVAALVSNIGQPAADSEGTTASTFSERLGAVLSEHISAGPDQLTYPTEHELPDGELRDQVAICGATISPEIPLDDDGGGSVI